MRTIAEVEANIDKAEDCWRWLRAHTTDKRPEVWFGGRMWYVYRLLYTHHVGPIPQGMTLDHVDCENGWCCNPWHCALATNGENVKRALAIRYQGRTACPKGHPYATSRRIRPGGVDQGKPYCSECGKIRAAAWKAQKGLIRQGI